MATLLLVGARVFQKVSALVRPSLSKFTRARNPYNFPLFLKLLTSVPTLLPR